VAHQERETLVSGRRVPRIDLVIDQPLIRASHGKRSDHQEVAAGKRDDKTSKPWAGISPKASLPAEDQAKDIEHCSPGVLVGFLQIAQYYLAFLMTKQLRGQLYQRPHDCVHEALPVRVSTHDAPRLTRSTAS